jgi:hypothetical protein
VVPATESGLVAIPEILTNQGRMVGVLMQNALPSRTFRGVKPINDSQNERNLNRAKEEPDAT